MYVDKDNEFSDDQAITATAISDQVIDLGAVPGDIGSGEPLYLVVLCTETFTDLTSLTVSLESAAAAALTSATVHASREVAAADLTAGAVLMSQSVPSADYGRRLGMRYTVDGTAPTAGKVAAFLTHDRQAWRAYPANVGR